MKFLAYTFFSVGLVAAQSGLDLISALSGNGFDNNENILEELLSNGFFGGQDISDELFDLGGLNFDEFNWNSLDQFGSGIDFNDIFNNNFDFNNQDDLLTGIEALASGFGVGNAFDQNDLFDLGQDDELELLLEMLQLQQLLQFGQIDIGGIQDLINNNLGNFNSFNSGFGGNDVEDLINELGNGNEFGNEFGNLGDFDSDNVFGDNSDDLSIHLGGGNAPDVNLNGVSVA